VNRTIRTRLATVVVAVAITAGLAACDPPAHYVSIGDSFTAGPLILDQRNDPVGCLRSTRNYPSLVAPRVAITKHLDPSCSGANTGDVFEPQGVTPGPNAPQIDRVDKWTTLVTIGIGGNDIGFSSIATTCGTESITDPLGSPCRDEITDAVIAQRLADAAPRVRAVIEAVKERAPKARIFVVGYPAILPESQSYLQWAACYPTLPIAKGDVAWLRDNVHKPLNAMIRTQALAAGVEYVDTYGPGIGHDACTGSGTRWVEPVIPGNLAAPIHPNARGMEGMADAVTAAMTAAGVPMR